mgnify:CR=1 FL=1|jgi:hypothetical protein
MDTNNAAKPIKFIATEFKGYYVSECGQYRAVPEFSSNVSQTIVSYSAQRLSDRKVVAEARSLKTLSARIAGAVA